MFDALLVPLIVAGVAILFPVPWCAVVWLIGATGWRRLAERYPTDAPDPPATYTWQSGRIGWANYNGVLRIGLSPEGLRLSVPLLFRPGHPPVLVPWTEVREMQEVRVWWTRAVRLEIGRPHVITLFLPARVMDAAQDVALDSDRETRR